MVPPDPSSRLRLILIAGLAVLAAAAASWGLRADQVHGLTARYFGNAAFEGEPVRVALEREPFVPFGNPAPFSAIWTGYFYAPHPGLYSFEVASDDDSQLDLDGQAVVSNPGHRELTGPGWWSAHAFPAPRLAGGHAKLTVGLHAFALRSVQRGATAYLRVGYHFDSGPIGAADPSNRPIGRPLPWSQLFPESFAPSPAAYAAAEGTYQRQRVLAAIALGSFIVSLILAWIEWRRRRGIGPAAPVDLAASLGVFGVGWIARLIGLDAQGRTWDERDYFLGAVHYLRNLMLGDGSTLAFRYNLEHPPIAKWIYAVFTGLFAKNDDDHTPGKLAASLMGAATCALLYLIVKELYDRRSAVLAGLLCALLPPFIAHGKTLGLEAPMTLFYVAALYGIVRWFKDDTRLEPLLWAGLCTSLAIFSRMTAVWLIPTLLVPYLYAVITGPDRGRRARAILPYLGGLALGVAVAYALWPWIWRHPYDQLVQTYAHWSGWKTREWYLGTFREPPFSYYEVAFLLSAPIGYLIPTIAWAVSSVWRGKANPPPSPRSSDLILAAFLLFPFLQSIAELRQDAVRYVIQAFPALAATSAVGFYQLWSLAEKRLPAARRPWAPTAAAGLLVAYAAGVCVWIHPYYLDYFNEILDGPAGMQRGKVCELSWWGEGITNLVDWVNANAPPNARVAEHFVPDFDVPTLRPDLSRVDEHSEADFIVFNDFSFAFAESRSSADLSYFRAGPSANWEVAYRATAGNQDIGWVYRRIGGH